MPASTLTSKGQLALPKAIRDRLNLHPGHRVEFRVAEGGEVVVETATLDLRDLKGSLRRARPAASVEEMNEAVRKAGTRF